MKKILVSGGTGQLGQEMAILAGQYPQYQFDIMNRSQLDLESEDSIKNILSDNTYNFFINTAAYTAVDKAEAEASIAYNVNSKAMDHISNYLNQDCVLIHISSDYVYHIGKDLPLVESDLCRPQGVYARSKYQGEEYVINKIPRSIILRTSWVYSSFGNNFVKTMLRLGTQKDQLSIVSDQIGSPTYAKNIAKAILSIIVTLNSQEANGHHYGIYNFTDNGYTNWADFARYIFKLKNIKCKVHNISTEDYGAAAPRPLWSVLSKDKIISDYKLRLMPWQESLEECLQLLA